MNKKKSHRTDLKEVIESRQRLDEEIATFVSEFVATSGEQVDRFIQVEIVMSKDERLSA